jgi:SAM-dependent methyltransferase
MASHSAPVGAGIDWEARYIASDTPWDKGAAHPALIDHLKKQPITGRVLVPGCGVGHDVRALAQNPALSILGMDIAPTALRLARSFPRAGNESYLEGDFLAGDAVEAGSFDVIFEHTCFCAIPPIRRKDYVKSASDALRSGGLLLAVFFTNPENTDPSTPPFRCEMNEIRGLFSGDFEFLEADELISTFRERMGRETLCLLRKKTL